MKTKTLIIITTFIILQGCSTTTKFYKPSCITDDYKGFSLQWGYINNINNSTTGYQLNEDGIILMFNQNNNQQPKYDSVCQILPEQLCNVLILYRNENLKIPVVNETGDKLTFIKIDKPAIDYKSNAIWNKFNTKISDGYRKIFDSLMLLVKPKK